MSDFSKAKAKRNNEADSEAFRRQCNAIYNKFKVFSADKQEGNIRREAEDCGIEATRENGHWAFSKGEMHHRISLDGKADEPWVNGARQTATNGSIALADLHPTRRKLLIGNMAARQKLSVIAASGGMTKSTMCAAIALGAAAGRNIFGMKMHEGEIRAGYLSTEDEVEEVQRLIKANAQVLDITDSHIRDRLSGYGFDNMPEWFSIVSVDPETRITRADKKSLQWLAEIITTQKLDVFFIDPLYGLSSGFELTPEMMNQIAIALKSLAQKCNCSIILVHHTRKGHGGGVVGADEVSGGKPLVSNSRATATVRTLTQDETIRYGLDERTANSIRVVDGVKMNLGRNGPLFHYQIVTTMLRDPETNTDYEMQAVKEWFPPTVTSGFNHPVWGRIVDIIDETPFVFFAPQSHGTSAPKFREIVQQACDEEARETGVRHDAKSLDKEIRERKYIEGQPMNNPGTQSREPSQGVVITDKGRAEIER